MKTIHKLIAFFAIMLLTASVAVAQDDLDEIMTTDGTFVQSATTASLIEVEEGVFTLTLDGVPAIMQWLVIGNRPEAGYYLTLDFSSVWAFASQEAEIEVEALLVTDEVVITLALSEPSFVDGVFTYAATIVELEFYDIEVDPDKSELSDVYENVVLFIPMHPDFMSNMSIGARAQMDSTRGSGKGGSCPLFGVGC